MTNKTYFVILSKLYQKDLQMCEAKSNLIGQFLLRITSIMLLTNQNEKAKLSACDYYSLNLTIKEFT
jgi:hypothetical protein